MHRPRWLLVAALALAACGGSREGVLDPCDGVDGDGDGVIDEGVGEAVGCSPREICIDAACVTPCGDALCDTENGESCASCAADCGACPRCGDGVCNGRDSCEFCPEDCGACPACGDGRCNGTETCTSCRDDCGLCPGECGACGAGFTCGSGLECGTRICDGAEACYGTSASATCPEVDGEPCPDAPAYARCTSDAECGSRMSCFEGHCTPVGFGGAAIPSYCEDPGTAVFCPPVPTSDPGLSVACIQEDVGFTRCCQYRCELRCTGACPYGMTCVSGTCS